MIYDNRPLSAAERIRLHVALENDSNGPPLEYPAGEVDPEPRRYPPEPALDVPRDSKAELTLVEHSRRLSHETVLDYRAPDPGPVLVLRHLSRQLSATHQRYAKARRRELLRKGCWVVWWTIALAVGIYTAATVAGWILSVVMDALP